MHYKAKASEGRASPLEPQVKHKISTVGRARIFVLVHRIVKFTECARARGADETRGSIFGSKSFFNGETTDEQLVLVCDVHVNGSSDATAPAFILMITLRDIVTFQLKKKAIHAFHSEPRRRLRRRKAGLT
jgi:hypothetical protein